MVLSEVLQLDKVQASIKKIDLFLASTDKMSDDYIIALSYKAMVVHSIGKTNEALKILFAIVPYFKDLNVEAIIAVCDGIITICIAVQRFDQVTKYIAIKRNYLPVSKQILNIKDNIKYYLAIHDNAMAKDSLLTYLADDITKEEAIFAKEELANIYFLEHQYDKYLEIGKDLEQYYQANLAIDKQAAFSLKKLYIAFESGNFVKVICDGNIYLKDTNLDVNSKLLAASYLIKSYLVSNDFKRASIVESDYEELLEEANNKAALEFSKAALELYTKTNTLISISQYQNRIKALESDSKEKKSPKAKKDDIVIPVVNVEQEVETLEKPKLNTIEPEISIPHDKMVVKTTTKYVKKIAISENYEKLSKVFEAINNLDIQAKFREVFRIACIELCKIFSFKEIYVLYYKKSYLGIHYKKERAYDKKLEFEDINQTLSFAAIDSGSEVFLDPEIANYHRDIVTGQDYEELTFGFAIPFMDNDRVIGSIAFISETPFLDQELLYESLKLISSMLNTRLLTALKQADLEYNNSKLFFINANMSSGMKDQVDDYLHFSSQACKILGVFEDISYNDFLFKMKPQYVSEYRRIIEELYTLLSEDVSYQYEFKKNDKWIVVKERFYPMVSNGIICIYSLLDDITESEESKKSLINLAYCNPISKLDTEVKLMVDLNAFYPDKKLSLCVIEINDFTLYIDLYGYNFANQLVYTVGQEFKKYFENDFQTYIYHLERDRFVLLFQQVNDKRTVETKLTNAFVKVSNDLFVLNARVKLLFNAGVYRLGKNVNFEDVSKILFYATDALVDATEQKYIGNHIAHFDSDLHLKRFNQNHLITHISEAIDHGKIGVTYQQIVDLDNNAVFGYQIRLNLDNFDIDYDYMQYVVERRGLSEQLEKYEISNVFKEQKMLYDASKGYLLCFISLSEDTLSESLYSFTIKQQTYYKIQPNYIVFIVKNAKNLIVKKLREVGYLIASYDILDCYSNYCDYYLYDFKVNGLGAYKEIKDDCLMHNVTCIVINIDEAKDIELAKTNAISYVFGRYYKKAIRMISLIEKINS